MGFKKMLGAFGVGGPSVDTVLTEPFAVPGGTLTGRVHLAGGSHDVELEHVTLGLVTRVEVEGGQGEHGATGEFHRVGVSGPLRLAEKQELALPFQIVLPWETPVTAVHGQHLHGMTMGVRTEVAVARAVDKGDLDLFEVHPLPVQERILDAFARLGFQFKGADLEYGRIAGVHQTLPFYQEIEYFPPAQYAHGVNEVELTFVTGPHTVEVVLEFDKRGGMFSGGHDAYGRYTVPHADAGTADWNRIVDGWVREAVSHHQSYGAPAYGVGNGGYGQSGYGHGGHGRGHGSGMGGMVAGVAGGMAAGYLAGEVMEEVFEDDGGDE